jgi:sulfatase modifying factor 1
MDYFADTIITKTMKIILILFFICQIIQAKPFAIFITTNMAFVKGGEFKMGNNEGKQNARPAHDVELSDFYIGKYEVTQGLWHHVMNSDTSGVNYCGNCPVYDVKWEAIQVFIAKLNQLTGNLYRLPTEAEWEYAARGGQLSKGYKYCGSDSVGEVAWYRPNADMKTHPVGLKKPNELGLYDMSGNVWEMCSDWYDAGFYKHSPSKNPNQSKRKRLRVLRGGSWRSEEERCRARARNKDVYDHHISNGGFRLVMEVN